MRKFVRLIIIVVVLFLLLYLTKYVNECRQMRQVFDSFIVSDSNARISLDNRCSLVNESVGENYEFLHFMDNPKPIWVDIGAHFVYSAFWITENGERRSVALGLGPEIEEYSCSVWLDYANVVSSVPGKFSYTRSKWNSSVYIYNFICVLDEENEAIGSPRLLVLRKSGTERKSFIPIYHKVPENYDATDKCAICVKPDSVGVGKEDIIEFISYHLLVGVSDLILYGNEIHNNLIHKVRRLIGSSNFYRSISVVQWNFPYNDKALESKLIEMDCTYRTFGITKALSVLDWDQYIVPYKADSILALISLDKPSVINFKSQICCLENRNDKRSELSWPIILKKTYCTDYTFKSYFRIHGSHLEEKIVTLDNYTSVISVKTYRNCDGLKNLKTKYDHSSFNFLSGLLSSELLRLWNTGSMF